MVTQAVVSGAPAIDEFGVGPIIWSAVAALSGLTLGCHQGHPAPIGFLWLGILEVAGDAAMGKMCYKEVMPTFDNSPYVVRPRQQRSRDALAKIVQAAEYILRADGPDGFSMAAVARVSGLPVGNIYRRFRSKEDILLLLKEHVTSRVEHAVLEKTDTNFQRFEEFVADFVQAVANTFTQDEVIHRVLFDPRVMTPAMTQIGSSARRRVFQHYRSKMLEFIPNRVGARVEAIITTSFNIIMYAIVGRAAGVDPLLNCFSWPDIAAEYTSAATAYLIKELAIAASTVGPST